MIQHYAFQAIATAVVVVAYFVLKLVAQKTLQRVAGISNYQKPRVKMTQKLVNVIVFLIGAISIFFIWGVDQGDLVLFLSSILTIIGIAFFAQWSILSNLTSTLIIFFNHPARIGDNISIIDKDYDIEGQITDIGMFYVSVEAANGDRVTVPNNVFIQKMVKWKPKKLRP